MKKEIKGFICGVIVTSLIGCMSISATGVWDKIDVLRNDINVMVNGTPVNADNFLYNDTTYLPMRAVAEALGKDVQYDESTNTATIKDKGDNNLSENVGNDVSVRKSNHTPHDDLMNDGRSIRVLDGQYAITGFGVLKIVYPYGINMTPNSDNTKLEFFGDDKQLIYSCDMYENAFGIYYDTLIDEILPALGIDNTPYL